MGRSREAAWGNRLGAKVGSALSPVVMRRIHFLWTIMWTCLGWLRAIWLRLVGCAGRFCPILRLSGCSLASRLLFVLVLGRHIRHIMGLRAVTIGCSFPERTFLA